MICNECGAQLKDDARFCNKCGVRTTADDSMGDLISAAPSMSLGSDETVEKAREIMKARFPEEEIERLALLECQTKINDDIKAALAFLMILDPDFELADDPFTMTEDIIFGTWQIDKSVMAEYITAYGKIQYYRDGYSVFGMLMAAEGKSMRMYALSGWSIKRGRLVETAGKNTDEITLLSKDHTRMFTYLPDEPHASVILRKTSNTVGDPDSPCIPLVGTWIYKKNDSVRLTLYSNGRWSFSSSVFNCAYSEGDSWCVSNNTIKCSYAAGFAKAADLEDEVFEISPRGDTIFTPDKTMKLVKENSKAHSRNKAFNVAKSFAEGFLFG